MPLISSHERKLEPAEAMGTQSAGRSRDVHSSRTQVNGGWSSQSVYAAGSFAS
jgi:hypothetical protein